MARIENIQGELVSELTGKAEPGLHLISWNLTSAAPPATRGGGGPGGGRGGANGSAANRVGPPGEATAGSAAGRTRRPAAGDGAAGRPTPPEGTRETPPIADAEGGEGSSDTTNPPEGGQARGPRVEGPAAGAQTGGRTGRAPQGFQGFRGPRPVPSGTYRVRLLVDGQPVASKVLSIVRDPGLPADAVADEVYELELLLQKQAKEFKFHNKSNGYGSFSDD